MPAVRSEIDGAVWLALIREGRTNAQIADHFGCTVRTLDRRRRDDASLNQAILALRAELAAANTPEHGTPGLYRRGCRCRPCVSANTARCYAERMAYRARRGLPPPDPTRGRPLKITEAVRLVEPTRATPRAVIEQAIARGHSTRRIMTDHAVDYPTVQAARQALDEAVAS